VGKHRSRVEDVVLKDVLDLLKTEKGKVAAVSMLDNSLKDFCSFRLSLYANG
jgi:hypothetical protein